MVSSQTATPFCDSKLDFFFPPKLPDNTFGHLKLSLSARYHGSSQCFEETRGIHP
jgi:hypothetical protein